MIKTIKQLCEEYGINQSELARMYDIPLRTVQDWHAGRRVPPSYVVKMLDELLALKQKEGTMLHRMQEDLQSGKISGVICSENGEAAVEHPAIIDRETYVAAQAVMKAENENQLEPQTNEEIKTGKTLGYFRVATAAQLELVPEEMPKPDSTPADVARYERKASSGQREEGIENQSQDCQEYAQRSGFITEEEAKQ